MKKRIDDIVTKLLAWLWMATMLVLSIGVATWAVKWVLGLLGVIG